jgi:hypothetical protein
MSRVDYGKQDTTITLAEGLAEYRKSFPGLIDETKVSPKARELFHAHDLCHVVFGCDTTIHDEAMVDTWTLFGTTVTVRAYVDYLRVNEARELFEEIGYLRTLLATIGASPDLWRVFMRTREMTKKWPFLGADAYLNVALDRIRDEFGIHLV